MKKQNKIERFFQKHAIQNLSLIIIMCYGFGYVLYYVNADFLNYLTLNPYAICRGQIWRLLTWLIVPPDTSNIFFVIIAMLFYYSIGTALERTWGTVEYNKYILGGVLTTVIGAFAVMGLSYLVYPGQLNAVTAPTYFQAVAQYFSTYYVNMSIFLAYAATFPNAQVLFMFIIPVKVKWLGIIYGILLAYDFVTQAVAGRWFVCIAMAASLANFLIYWLRTRDIRRYSPSEIKRRREFRRSMEKGEKERRENQNRYWNGKDGGKAGGRFSGRSGNESGWNSNSSNGSSPQNQNHDGGSAWQKGADGWYTTRGTGESGNRNGSSTGNGYNAGSAGGYSTNGPVHMQSNAKKARHRCAICGRTELDDPNLEFRYCSKCQGNYEFCQDHLFTHIHAANGQGPRLMNQSADNGNKE